MAKIVEVNHPSYGRVKLNVERVIAVCFDKHWLLFEEAYWPLSEGDFNKVYEAWKDQGLKYNPETKSIDEIKGNNGGIPHKFKQGDTIKYVGERRELAADKYTIKNVLTDMYVTTTGTIIPFKYEQHYEFVEPEQENSPNFKELERNGKDERMVVEEILVSLIRRAEKSVLTPDFLAKEFAPKLIEAVHNRIESEERLGITKKEFEEELELLYTYADEVVYSRGYDKGIEDARKRIVEAVDVNAMVEERAETTGHCGASIRLYRDGIEDLLKKIKEG